MRDGHEKSRCTDKPEIRKPNLWCESHRVTQPTDSDFVETPQ